MQSSYSSEVEGGGGTRRRRRSKEAGEGAMVNKTTLQAFYSPTFHRAVKGTGQGEVFWVPQDQHRSGEEVSDMFEPS